MLGIAVYDKEGGLIDSKEGENLVHLRIGREYLPGDYIRLRLEEKSFYRMLLEPCLGPSVVYAEKEEFCCSIPFEDGRIPYPPGAFSGSFHILEIEKISIPQGEIHDLSTNPNDIRGESSVFPHCTASVETRGEAVFAARNTIDGWKETDGHGIWPFTSWGDNEDPGAEIQISFGRIVEVTEAIIYLRADFPHDNYWKQMSLCFSDGSEKRINLEQTGAGQLFSLPHIRCEWVKICKLVKDEENPSPFPALSYWQINGREVIG